MGTKTTSTSTNQYNSGAMNTYNAFQPAIGSTLMSMVNNPLGSSMFQNQLAQAQSATRQINQRSNANLMQNMRAGGGVLSNSAGFMAGALGRNQLGANFMQGNAFNSALNSALQNRATGLMSMEAYQPLQTGQTSTQQTSGLGTWLPQVAGMAMNALMPGVSSMMGGNPFSAGYSRPPSYSGAPSSGSMSPSGGYSSPSGGFQLPPNSPWLNGGFPGQ